MEDREQAKRRAAAEAVRLAQSGWVIGLGTGTTAAYAIEELGRRARQERASFVGIPTSYASETLARRHGIPLATLEDAGRIDLAIDGADEVDRHKNLVKGGGGAHTREKIVDYFAKRFVVVVDETKVVEQLGTTVPVPVEVLPVAVSTVSWQIMAMDGTPQLRRMRDRPGQDAPFITDQGNMVLDVRFPAIEDPKNLEWALNNIPGVVENGLFAERAHLVIIGLLDSDEVRRLE